MPMDNTFTPEFNLSESLIRTALKSESFPSPSESALSFIRNFARNLCVHNEVEGSVQEILLN